MNEQLTQIADGWMQKTTPTFNDLFDSIILSKKPDIIGLIRNRSRASSKKPDAVGLFWGKFYLCDVARIQDRSKTDTGEVVLFSY